MRLHKLCRLVVVASAFGASASSAQIFFTDDIGRSTEFSAPEVMEISLSAEGRSPNEIAQLFRSACLDNNLDPAAIEKVVAAAPWAMKRADVKIPFTRSEFDRPVPQWFGKGFGVIATPTTIGIPSGSGFRIAGPQCNLVSGFPNFSSAELEAALVSVLGGQPVNAAEAMKNGKPNKSYMPRWTWTGNGGVEQKIGFTIMRGYENRPGKLQIALIPPKAVKRK